MGPERVSTSVRFMQKQRSIYGPMTVVSMTIRNVFGMIQKKSLWEPGESIQNKQGRVLGAPYTDSSERFKQRAIIIKLYL